jgi:hypothetical protein
MDTQKKIIIPEGFRYIEVLLRGKPVHEKFDSFSIRHPSMPLEKRAKIFSPFDALKGFDEAISAKNAIYEYRKSLSDEDMQILDQKLCLLRQLTMNSKSARESRIPVEITYFRLLEDPNMQEEKGRYLTDSGILMKVDTFSRMLILDDDRRIPIDDIISINSPVFDSLIQD